MNDKLSKFGLVIVVLIATFIIVSCAPAQDVESPTDAPPADGGEMTASVTMRNSTFQPAEITVSAGTTVTWTNEDAVPHTVTSGTRDNPTGSFDASVASGGTFSFTFEDPGTYEYHCTIHPGMDGVVIVE
jgi:amicyanin